MATDQLETGRFEPLLLDVVQAGKIAPSHILKKNTLALNIYAAHMASVATAIGVPSFPNKQNLLILFVLSRKNRTGRRFTAKEEPISLRAPLDVQPCRTFQADHHVKNLGSVPLPTRPR